MTDEKFVNLHCHSTYSLLDGMATIDDMVQCCKDMNFKSIALTDHGTCAGLFGFQEKCKKAGIKPILGSEFYITNDMNYREKDSKNNHLIIFAKNEVGYKNLIKLSTYSYINGFYSKPRIDFNLLEKHKEGLIVSSACCAGEIPSLIEAGDEEKVRQLVGKYKETFKDDFYIEIMKHEYINDKAQQDRELKLAIALYKLSKSMGIKAICTNDSHYARKDDWEAHDVLLSIQTIDMLKNPDRFTFDSKDFYIKSYEEMFSIYHKVPELLINTVEISEKVESNLIKTSSDLLPPFKLPEGFDSEENYLKELVTNGMVQKGMIRKQEYRDRIKFEMSVIVKCKYTRYFLLLWDVINFAKTNQIRVGCGRGSCVGSLCLYVLGVTQLDPLKYDLLFERFLNPDRISPPDVDLDFDYNRRDEIYNYIIKKYGEEYTSNIGTYNSLQARATIRGAAKVFDLANDWEKYQEDLKNGKNVKVDDYKKSLDLADNISKSIPFKAESISEAIKDKKSDFRLYASRYPKLIDCALKIEGTLASGGVHPAGILLCKDKIIDHVPLKLSKGIVSTQYVGPEVEKIGLLKFDLLALKTITVIDKTIKMVKERHQIDLSTKIDELEPNDEKIFNVFNSDDKKVDINGIFQFESYGMTRLLKDIRVDRFEDMIVANALYRPGPLEAGIPLLYCNSKHGRNPEKPLHPKMAEILKKTYGLMIFQEDTMSASKSLAGFTAGQADTLRKAIGKKDDDLMRKMEELFINGCINNGIDREIVVKIWQQIKYFGGYGFNKCLSGDTLVKNKIDNKTYNLKELCDGSYGVDKDNKIILDSYVDGNIINDDLIEVFETGEKDIYEIELENGMIIKATLDHKFYCNDGEEHTVEEIIEKNLEIIYE